MKTSETTTNLTNALVEAQLEFPAVEFDMDNNFLGYSYATLKAVLNASKPILKKHGLVIMQTPCGTGGMVGVTTRLAHVSGEWIEDTIEIALETKKGLTNAQQAGAVISYLRRYSWGSILGLITDKDTDGQIGVETTEIASKAPPKERVFSMDALEAVVKAQVGATTHEEAKAILDLSTLPESASAKLVGSWVAKFAASSGGDAAACAMEANEAYKEAKKNAKNGGK